MSIRLHFTLILNLFLSLSCLAQGGWQLIYPMLNGGPHGDGIEAVRQTPDGGYILAGITEHNSGAHHNRVTKVNDLGAIQWSYTYDEVGSYSWVSNIELAPNGDFIVEGYRTNPQTFSNEVYILRINAFGILQWIQFYPQAMISTKGSICADGGYISIGYFDHNSQADTLVLIKTSASGSNELLVKYPNVNNGIARLPHSVIQTSNGDYVVEGYNNTGQNGRTFLWRLNSSGETLWQQMYGFASSHPEYIGKVIETTDNNLVAVGNDATSFGAHNAYLIQVNADGNLIWEQRFNLISSFGTDVAMTSDGGYILTGYIQSSTSPKIFLIKTNGLGEEEFSKIYDGDGAGQWKAYCVRQTNDGGYIIGGARISGFYTRRNLYLIKTDSLGEIYSNTLSGFVYADFDDDCAMLPDDYRFSNWIVKAQGEQTFLTSTDANGFYWMRVDTGNYMLTLHPAANSAYWESAVCNNDSIALSIPNQNTAIETHFAQTAAAFCPLLNVELGTPFLRRCFPNNYFVHYSNTGTFTASGAFIDVTFDDYLDVIEQSITVPFTMENENTYRFVLPEIGIGESGSFVIPVMVSCDAELGQAHCSEARIYPDSSCFEPLWTGPIIHVQGNCTPDSVIFTITNSGSTMQEIQNYVIIQNNEIIFTGNFQLGEGDFMEHAVAIVENATYRIEAFQQNGFPPIAGDVIAAFSVEGCGSGVNPGFVAPFAPYDGSPFYDLDCRVNIGAYDPNDKQASPEGYGENHFIYLHNDLDYRIRFQNTGTDTAFTVVIRDTISSLLDITTLQPGAASHPYTWRIYGEGVQAVEFTFSQIMLPDSFVNEPASNGFIHFRIQQKDGNTLGSIIENRAGIYFDFNEPIFTNTTFHTLGEDFVEENIITKENSALKNTNQASVHPNPFQDYTTIRISDSQSPIKKRFFLYDTMGKLVRDFELIDSEFILNRNELTSGMYFYRIEGNQNILHEGKILVQ